MVGVLVEHPTELRADLQRVYGLNLSHCGRAFSPFHLSALVAQLPLGSATLAAIDQKLGYTLTERMIMAFLGVEAEEKNEIPELGALPAEEFWDWYSKPRQEVKYGSKRW